MTKRRKLLVRAVAVLALGIVGFTSPRTADAAALECFSGTICADSCDGAETSLCSSCPEGVHVQCDPTGPGWPDLGCGGYTSEIYCAFKT